MSKSLCWHKEPLIVEGEAFTAREVIDGLVPYLTEERRERIRGVVAHRTYSVVPVMEGLYDRGNVSAVLRSAEALGYQAVHIIESSARFKEAKRVTQGAEKWLDTLVWQSTGPCLDHLREQGYRILATHVDAATPIAEVDFTIPSALVFGNEREGVSQEVLDVADACIVAPMPGFSRSFNISVAAAVCFYHIYMDRQQRLGKHGDLTEEEERVLTADFYLRCVPSAGKILMRGREDRARDEEPA